MLNANRDGILGKAADALKSVPGVGGMFNALKSGDFGALAQQMDKAVKDHPTLVNMVNKFLPQGTDVNSLLKEGTEALQGAIQKSGGVQNLMSNILQPGTLSGLLGQGSGNIINQVDKIMGELSPPNQMKSAFHDMIGKMNLGSLKSTFDTLAAEVASKNGIKNLGDIGSLLSKLDNPMLKGIGGQLLPGTSVSQVPEILEKALAGHPEGEKKSITDALTSIIGIGGTFGGMFNGSAGSVQGESGQPGEQGATARDNSNNNSNNNNTASESRNPLPMNVKVEILLLVILAIVLLAMMFTSVYADQLSGFVESPAADALQRVEAITTTWPSVFRIGTSSAVLCVGALTMPLLVR